MEIREGFRSKDGMLSVKCSEEFFSNPILTEGELAMAGGGEVTFDSELLFFF